MVALMAGPSLDELRQAFFGLGFVVLGFAAASALIVSLLGILYMAVVVAPNATQRFAGALRERNLASLLTGLPVMGVFAFAGAITHRTPALSGISVLIFAVSVILAFAAAAEDVGRRLFWACGREGSRAAQLATGWLVLSFGSLFPVIGWFLILPYALLSGLGSLVIGSFPRRPEPARAPVEI
jgi:hypothetical protein